MQGLKPFPKPRYARRCEKCGKSYMPNNHSQKYCENCRPKIKHLNVCVVCGRKSNVLIGMENPKCSFCCQAEAKARHSDKRHICRSCGKPSCHGLIYQKFHLCISCFEAKNVKPSCPRCGNMSDVRLSDQETPESNMVLWFCKSCDFVFKSEVVTA